jgi:hypothetical protein
VPVERFQGMMGIGVFAENRTLFDHAVDMWRARVPAYYYLSSVDGEGQPAELPECPRLGAKGDGWNGQTVFNANVDGVCAETCRDFGHTQFAVASTFNAAETARIQGVDLYLSRLMSFFVFPLTLQYTLSYRQSITRRRGHRRRYETPNTAARLAATMEFHTGLLNAGAANGWPTGNPYHFQAKNISNPNLCGGKPLKLGYMPATFQIGLTALQRLGYKNLTQTTKYVKEYIQPLSGKDHDACDAFMCCFEALTHGAWHP